MNGDGSSGAATMATRQNWHVLAMYRSRRIFAFIEDEDEDEDDDDDGGDAWKWEDIYAVWEIQPIT